MLSLKQLKNIEAQPDIDTMPILDSVNDEEGYVLVPDEPSSIEPEVQWYEPKKSWKLFFAERESGKTEWEIPVLDKPLPKEIKLNEWTYITDVKQFVSSHLGFVKKHNGNKYFESYLKRLLELKLLINY